MLLVCSCCLNFTFCQVLDLCQGLGESSSHFWVASSPPVSLSLKRIFSPKSKYTIGVGANETSFVQFNIGKNDQNFSSKDMRTSPSLKIYPKAAECGLPGVKFCPRP